METIKNISAWLSVLGLPTCYIIAAGLCKRVKDITKKQRILMSAIQAEMRGRLITQYRFYIEQGYIEDDDLEQWESEYQAYHSLGKNGVLDARREELLRLPLRDRKERLK